MFCLSFATVELRKFGYAPWIHCNYVSTENYFPVYKEIGMFGVCYEFVGALLRYSRVC